MTKQFYVYTHAKPDGSIFYVGKGLKKRTASISRAYNPHHTNIVAKYGKENIIVKTMLCRSEQHAFDLEVRMIAALRQGGVKLVNLTDGGEGASGWKHTDEHKLKLSVIGKGRVMSPEHCARQSARQIGTVMSIEARAKMSISKKNMSVETKAKMSLAQKGKKLTPEHRAKIAASGIGRVTSPETKAKISASNTGKIRTVEHCAEQSARQIGGIASEKTREKMSQAHKGRIHSPESIAKVVAFHTGRKRSEETKAKISASKNNLPAETRARMSDTAKKVWTERKAKAAFRGQLSLF